MTNQELIERARSAMENAYAPYSGFRVGAALLCGDGSVTTGCNVENASYGASICAERAAVAAAVAAGKRDFVKIAIISSGEEPCYPCGICRQVIREFGAEMEVICAGSSGRFEAFTAGELLPNSFCL